MRSFCGICNQLTGIDNKDLVNANLLKDIIKTFGDWVGDAICVSWSLTDKNQILRETELKGIELGLSEITFEEWIDCQKLFSKKIKSKSPKTLQEALIASDVTVMGAEHDGYCDAYNTGLLFEKLMNNPEYALNKYYYAAKYEDVKPMSFGLGGLFANIDLTVLPA